MHSSRNPTAESERFSLETLQSTKNYSSTGLVLFGCGALHPIQAIYNSIKEFKSSQDCNLKYIIALEPILEIREDVEFKKESLVLKDSFHRLGIDLEFFHISETNSMKKLIQVKFKKQNESSFSLDLVAFPFYKRNFPDQWKSIQDFFHITTNSLSLNESTSRNFAKIWTTNFFKNLQDIRELNQLSILSPMEDDVSRKKSLLFIGAGPNLEDQIDKIKIHKNNFFLLSSDTALGYLLNKDLIPDGMISIDSGRGTFYHIPDRLPQELRIFTWMGACRKLFNFKEQISLFLTTHPLDQALQQYTELDDKFILKNPSLNIAGIAIALAEYWKFSTVYLAGFGLKAIHGKTHCRSTGYESFYLPKINRRNTLNSLYPKKVYGRSQSSKNENSYEEITKQRASLKVFDFDQFLERNSSPNPEEIFSPPVRMIPALKTSDLAFLYNMSLPGTDRISLNRHLKF